MKYKILNSETMEVTLRNIATTEGETRKLYRIQATKTFTNLATGKIIHAGDKGGWVSQDGLLSHEGTCWLADDAKLFDSEAEVSGNAYVCDNAMVCESAAVSDMAVVSGNVEVRGWCLVRGDAKLSGNAKLDGTVDVRGNAKVSGNAVVNGLDIEDEVEAYTILQGDCYVSGDATVRFGVYDGDTLLKSGTWFAAPLTLSLDMLRFNVVGDSEVAVTNTDTGERVTVDFKDVKNSVHENFGLARKQVETICFSENEAHALESIESVLWNIWVASKGFCNVVAEKDIHDEA